MWVWLSLTFCKVKIKKIPSYPPPPPTSFHTSPVLFFFFFPLQAPSPMSPTQIWSLMLYYSPSPHLPLLLHHFDDYTLGIIKPNCIPHSREGEVHMGGRCDECRSMEGLALFTRIIILLFFSMESADVIFFFFWRGG